MAGDQFKLPRELATVNAIFERFCAQQALTILGEAVDKHGSWEWAAASPGEINRFVSLAFTEQPGALGSPTTYSAEVWAEAEKGDRRRLAQRLLASTFRTNAQAIAKPLFEERLTAALTQAWQRASLLSERDLHELPTPVVQ